VDFLQVLLRAMIEQDTEGLHSCLAQEGFLPDASRFDPEKLMTFMLDAYWWCTADDELRMTPELSNKIVTGHFDPTSPHFAIVRRLGIDANADHMLGRRLELLVLAVLGKLEASANWHRIVREWIYDDPPSTELGAAWQSA
jgi:hypothetical protein